MINGLHIVISPDRPRYQLPEQVMPGIDWPPGFRDEINAWASRELGIQEPLIPDGQMLRLQTGGRVQYHVNPRTYEAMRKALGGAASTL